MIKQFLTTSLTTVMLVSPAFASEKLTEADKIQLQVTMQKSISRSLVDGQYLHFDADKDKVVTLYPTKAHPMIMRMGAHFILCSDFKNIDGKSVNIDFYITRRNDQFVVFETIVDNRAPIGRMMKAGVVTAAN